MIGNVTLKDVLIKDITLENVKVEHNGNTYTADVNIDYEVETKTVRYSRTDCAENDCPDEGECECTRVEINSVTVYTEYDGYELTLTKKEYADLESELKELALEHYERV